MSETEGDLCVVCLEPKRSPVKVNCGHSFCGKCLDQYKSYDKHKWAKKCPICRRDLKSQTASESLEIQNPDTILGPSDQDNVILEQLLTIATADEYQQNLTDMEDDDISDLFYTDDDDDGNVDYYYFDDDDESEVTIDYGDSSITTHEASWSSINSQNRSSANDSDDIIVID
ncbi:uncharacterized protein LOC142240192 [Haematobia irritans]|uniref:uncharacterized protein LOC142240192 n=1 Tax=Haematobia irritans TaxID=7368 RepID=UPI003F507B62